jgi:hypothetical protein
MPIPPYVPGRLAFTSNGYDGIKTTPDTVTTAASFFEIAERHVRLALSDSPV